MRDFIRSGDHLAVANRTKGMQFEVVLTATARERAYILAGGLLAWIKSREAPGQ